MESKGIFPVWAPLIIRSDPSDANPLSGAECVPAAWLRLKRTESQKLCFRCATSLFKKVIYIHWLTFLDTIFQHNHSLVFFVCNTAAPKVIQCLSNKSLEEFQTMYPGLGVAEPPGLLTPKVLATYSDHRTKRQALECGPRSTDSSVLHSTDSHIKE